MVNWKKFLKSIPHVVQWSRKGFYEVVWVDSFKDNETMGETRFNPNQIAIKSGYSPKETVHTYLHECIHAISAEYDVGLTETQVQKLEKAVYYILKKNNVFILNQVKRKK